MNTFVFTKKAEALFSDLSKQVQERILEKLKNLKSHPDIFSVLKNLHHFEPATHRLRVGTYRLILELRSRTGEECVFWILELGDRKDIYR